MFVRTNLRLQQRVEEKRLLLQDYEQEVLAAADHDAAVAAADAVVAVDSDSE